MEQISVKPNEYSLISVMNVFFNNSNKDDTLKFDTGIFVNDYNEKVYILVENAKDIVVETKIEFTTPERYVITESSAISLANDMNASITEITTTLDKKYKFAKFKFEVTAVSGVIQNDDDTISKVVKIYLLTK